MEIILLAVLFAALLWFVALGVEDARYWKTFRSEPIRVQVSVVFVDSAYPQRQSLPSWAKEAAA